MAWWPPATSWPWHAGQSGQPSPDSEARTKAPSGHQAPTRAAPSLPPRRKPASRHRRPSRRPMHAGRIVAAWAWEVVRHRAISTGPPAARRPREPLSAARTRSAAAWPSPMQAATPTPRYAAPHRSPPEAGPASASMRATRSRWPTVYCGSARSKRNTRASERRRVEAHGLREVRARDRISCSSSRSSALRSAGVAGGALQQHRVAGQVRPLRRRPGAGGDRAPAAARTRKPLPASRSSNASTG